MNSTNNYQTNSRVFISSLCLLYFLLTVFSNIKVKAQQNQLNRYDYRNTVYMETLGATGLGLSVNFKKSFWLKDKFSINASAGIGIIAYSFNEMADCVLPFSMSFVHGNKNSFEWGLGLSYLLGENILAPNIALGYRLQADSFFLWAGLTPIMFFESYKYQVNYSEPKKTRWELITVIPVPGIRLGKSF